MKLKVIKRFKDKNNLSVIYEAGQEVSFDDEARCSNLIERGLAKPVEPKAENPAKAEPAAAPSQKKTAPKKTKKNTK